MLDYRAPNYSRIDLEEGLVVRTMNRAVLEKHDLLGKGALHFVNAVSDLVEDKKEELPEEEYKVLAATLKRLMIDYEDGELYRHLLHTHGADAINYNAWVHFSDDCVWSVCVKTFTDMPTEILEEYGARHWADRDKTIGAEGSKHIMEALSRRSDMYGSLPGQMVKGIIFNHPVED